MIDIIIIIINKTSREVINNTTLIDLLIRI